MPPKSNPEEQTDRRPFMKKKSNASDDAKWNLAKDYLKSKDLVLAKKVLTELTVHPNSYSDKASKMLQKINK